MTHCTCPACREPTRCTPTADGVLLPTASPKPVYRERPASERPFVPPDLDELRQYEPEWT